jgi:hypothetical protein
MPGEGYEVNAPDPRENVASATYKFTNWWPNQTSRVGAKIRVV